MHIIMKIIIIQRNFKKKMTNSQTEKEKVENQTCIDMLKVFTLTNP